ncbi:hypothetical protein GW17_00015607, partial [Ensete ventricosum]
EPIGHLSSAPVLRRTLEEGFASSSSVAPNSPIRSSGPSDRFGCRRVHRSPARSLVFRNFLGFFFLFAFLCALDILGSDEYVDRCYYSRFGTGGGEFYYDWVPLHRVS